MNQENEQQKKSNNILVKILKMPINLVRNVWNLSKTVKILLLCAILLTSFLVYWFYFKNGSSTALKTQFANVTRGDFMISISGSAPLTPSNKRDISPKVGGTITKVAFLKGDKVKAGDLMFEMDDTDAVTNLQNIRNNYTQSELLLNSNTQDLEKLVVNAPFSGQVTNILIKKDDTAAKGATILTLTDTSSYKILLPFNATAINTIKPGQKVTLYLADLMQSTSGIVTYANDKSFTSTNGGQVFSVEIKVDNPGSLTKGLRASAVIQTPQESFTSTEYGTLDYLNYQVIKTDNGGTITSVNVKENQIVNKGDLLASFQNDSLELTKETTDSKLRSISQQIDTAQKTVDNYKVYAPIDGVVIKQTIRVGDVVKAGDIISSLSNNDLMEFAISIDELDIARIKVGQKVSITIDALPETTKIPLSGTVSDIALEGAASSGVTTYPVVVTIDGNPNLKGGMNANAQIIIDQKTNVLKLPLNAVQKMGNRSYVMVPGNPATANAQGQQSSGWQQTFNKDASGSSANGTPPNGTSPNGASPRQRTGNGTGAGVGTDTAGASNPAGASAAGRQRRTQSTTGGSIGGGNNTQQNANPLQRLYANNPQLQTYYANAVPKFIEIGLNNEDSIEILSGLNENDQVLLPPVFTSAPGSTTPAPASGMRLPGMGGGGGGMGGGMGGGGGAPGGNNRQQRGD